jgi:hypothetical protein
VPAGQSQRRVHRLRADRIEPHSLRGGNQSAQRLGQFDLGQVLGGVNHAALGLRGHGLGDLGGAVPEHGRTLPEDVVDVPTAVDIDQMCAGCAIDEQEPVRQQPGVAGYPTGQYAPCPFGQHP